MTLLNSLLNKIPHRPVAPRAKAGAEEAVASRVATPAGLVVQKVVAAMEAVLGASREVEKETGSRRSSRLDRGYPR